MLRREKIKYVVLLLCAIPAYGANEICTFSDATTCWACVREADGNVWHVVDQQFEVWGKDANDADDYDIAMVDKSGDMFVGTMDTNISAGYYWLVTHQQIGGVPADTDPAVFKEYGYWTGQVWSTGPMNVDTIADQVWDEAIAGHTTETSFGGEVGGLDPNLTLVFADSNELQTDWADGGRLDLLIDAIQAVVDRLFLEVTDIDTPNDANTFTLTDGMDANDVYEGCIITIQDVTDSHYESRIITMWNDDFEVEVNLPFGFTPAASDPVWIWSIGYTDILIWNKMDGMTYPAIYIDGTRNSALGINATR